VRRHGQACGARGEGGGNRQEAGRPSAGTAGRRAAAQSQINLTDEDSRIMPVAGGDAKTDPAAPDSFARGSAD